MKKIFCMPVAIAISLPSIALALPETKENTFMVEIPETIVQISIHDLISIQERRLKPLRASYPKEVAAAIAKNKKHLLKCLQPNEEKTFEGDFSLDISGTGDTTAKASALRTSALHVKKCIIKVLNKIRFPSHHLKKNVTINFPLKLKKKVL